MEEHVMMILENKKLRLELDGSGRILSLENKADCPIVCLHE